MTTRTVRHDVDQLRGLGYPVDAQPGVAGGYRLGTGGALPPLLLDDDEAVAIAVGLGSAASSALEGIEETAFRALAKLQQVLPARLRARVAAVEASLTRRRRAGTASTRTCSARSHGRVTTTSVSASTTAATMERPAGVWSSRTV